MTIVQTDFDYGRATALNMAEFFVGGARDSGQRFEDWDDVRASDRKMPDPMTNSTFLIKAPEPASWPGLIERLTAFYAATGSSWILWSAWPTPDLASAGFHPVGHPPLMLLDRTDSHGHHVDGLEISEVGTAEELVQFNRTFCEGYPVNLQSDQQAEEIFGAGMIGGPVRFWNGYEDGHCVSVSSACISDGIVTVNAVATRETARKRGYGGALTAVAANCEPDLPVLLLASDLGRPVYERLGFVKIGEFTLWYHP